MSQPGAVPGPGHPSQQRSAEPAEAQGTFLDGLTTASAWTREAYPHRSFCDLMDSPVPLSSKLAGQDEEFVRRHVQAILFKANLQFP